jgi:hypothetical protein
MSVSILEKLPQNTPNIRVKNPEKALLVDRHGGMKTEG